MSYRLHKLKLFAMFGYVLLQLIDKTFIQKERIFFREKKAERRKNI